MSKKKQKISWKQRNGQNSGADIVRSTGSFLLDCLFPPRCPICDVILRREERYCCADCASKLPWVRQPTCMKCGKPIGNSAEEYCDDCSRTPHFFDRGVAAFTYTGRLRSSVYRMKADNRRDYLDFFATAMAAALQPHLVFWQPERIVPVPMHWKKKRKRGYNQSELLAKRISMRTGIPMDAGMLQCVRAHTAQKTLNRKERMRNLKDSFVMKKQADGIRSVLLIDDVYTTGSTVDELSRILKKAGITCVYFLVLCTGKGKKTVCMDENVCYTK